MRRLFRRRPEHRADIEPALLIVGLGNPGAGAARNRHNVGFWVVNRLARLAGVEFTRRGRLLALAEGEVAGRPVALAKPQTFVNNSGEAVRELLRRYRMSPEQLVVVYDDLDVPVGTLRIRERGSHGGQNGMRSIIAAIGSQEFPRVRIGIGRPLVGGQETRDPEHVAAYVLSDPSPEERKLLDLAAERAVEALRAIVADGLGSAMARFNSGQ
jgi:PTH1 family peptidyl-tRNA hydrolase